MTDKVDVAWTQDMSFDASIDGHTVTIDAIPAVGGKDRGPRPKPLLLASLGGCTGMDVVSILHKMQVEFEGLRVEVEGDLTDEHPRYYHSISIRYIFSGRDLPMGKLEKAVSLSHDRYCGVTAMLGKTARIESSITVE